MAFAALGESLNNANQGAKFIPDTEKDKELLNWRRKRLLDIKGVQQFTIDGYTVMARNHKNAVRKVNNLRNHINKPK